MSADSIIYCLERVTDYRGFERFCSALLVCAGYPSLDPLGGTGDGGRDAIVRNDDLGRKICFAFTVRSDWRAKLASDCKRVQEEGHNPEIFVFVCTEAISASQKDIAYQQVADSYGWTLDLFDLERIRVLLAGSQRHLIAQHPGIFTPPFFPQLGGQSIAASSDTLIIDHVEADHAVAAWLSRRLSLAGFRTWCVGTAPLAGENADETIRRLTTTRASHYLPFISLASLADSMFVERCTIAATREDFVLPCCTFDASQSDIGIPSRIARLNLADFKNGWSIGLASVLARLSSLGVQPSLDTERGRQIALRDFLPTRVTAAKPEPVYANVFPLHLPEGMLVFDLEKPLIEEDTLPLRQRWAFVKLNELRLIAFMHPPEGSIPATKVKRTPEFLWRSFSIRDGKKTVDVAKELARRSLEVACAQKELKFCTNRKVFYFPWSDNKEWNQKIEHVDGRLTTVQLTGKVTKGWGERASQFRYQLSPSFQPQRDADGTWTIVVKVYVRVTTLDGTVFEGKEIGRRRKVVTKSWWNNKWLARLLGVVQALQTSQGKITIGEANRAVIIGTQPLTWQCPVGLDVLALSGISDLGGEIAQYRTRDEDEPEIISVVEANKHG